MDSKELNEVNLHIASSIKKIRKAQKLTQEYLAKQLDLSVQQIQRYEDGRQQLSVGRLYEISKVLQISPSQLFPPNVLNKYKDLPEVDELLTDFRELPKEERAALVVLTKSLAKRFESK
ncbi:helix-turn-helix domain-containing protein [Sneathiella glossodoripedis]|uniref:helix-turn-helix domain-containing protein n=1 Tax=Sneathiella glossodoripedis TaxID=418853 RepID=UPI000472ECED|nr:helix-turn-helix transcriptional regulator [Sneathiella glossodoripedis]